MLTRHRIVGSHENPRLSEVRMPNEGWKKRIILKPMKLELRERDRGSVTGAELRCNPVIHAGVDDEEAIAWHRRADVPLRRYRLKCLCRFPPGAGVLDLIISDVVAFLQRRSSVGPLGQFGNDLDWYALATNYRPTAQTVGIHFDVRQIRLFTSCPTAAVEPPDDPLQILFVDVHLLPRAPSDVVAKAASRLCNDPTRGCREPSMCEWPVVPYCECRFLIVSLMSLGVAPRSSSSWTSIASATS
jgi:hypothetical protein